MLTRSPCNRFFVLFNKDMYSYLHGFAEQGLWSQMTSLAYFKKKYQYLSLDVECSYPIRYISNVLILCILSGSISCYHFVVLFYKNIWQNSIGMLPLIWYEKLR